MNEWKPPREVLLYYLNYTSNIKPLVFSLYFKDQTEKYQGITLISFQQPKNNTLIPLILISYWKLQLKQYNEVPYHTEMYH